MDAAVGTASGLKDNFPGEKLLLVPAVPLATMAVATLPVIGGLLIVATLFFLPIVLAVVALMLGLGAIGSTGCFSTRDGRTSVQHIAEPTPQTFLTTETGQRVIYDVGPRPVPRRWRTPPCPLT